jgi:hypothetical protein
VFAPIGPSTSTSTEAGPPASASREAARVDVTAETLPDTEADGAGETARYMQLMLAQHEVDDVRQARIDRMRSEFDGAQQERAELLREMNVLRDMALEQQKHDDEILKKWIALI